MVCLKDPLVKKICEFYEKISRLDSLEPSEDVNTLLTELVLTCMPPYQIDCTKLCKKIQEIRSELIRLCGEAEGLLEKHYSTILGSFDNPIEHLDIFPYFSNYLKLSLLEFNILSQHIKDVPSRVAFVGSGPLPLTSIVLASNHMTSTTFHNYDIDSSANSMASRLMKSDLDLSKRMIFHTTDIMNVTSALKDYDVVFLAALVGMNKDEKVRVLEHLNKHMAPGALLMLRSAHGARAFLYPVVDPCDLQGFEVLSVFHPTDEVINSVVIARKSPFSMNSSIDHGFGPLMLCSKCAEIQVFNPLSQMTMIEELVAEEHHC
ncbi:nicotianamine synthase-like [Olea europaea var. sylvestris]|uniref:Nicotianamine synthase n=1 Tax=Olea europaea subsp. europaea TaxID=158383 RepID=A0A8S0UR80_OLEEU|nr:nicotianamine synthase-like [Olea europaea var. sylvestris]CAA3020770.1 nicotianamine synthase-like [Olea europaea subsp. europaea]